jgi:hypothetical protein
MEKYHQKFSNGTVLMVQKRFVKTWYCCYQGIDSKLVEVAGVESSTLGEPTLFQ